MTTSDTAASTKAVLDALAVVLDGIGAGQLDDPTPCSEFTVRDLRDHVVEWSTAFATGFADPDGKAQDASTVTTDGNGSAQVRRAASQLTEGVARNGLDGQLDLGVAGAMPAQLALAMVLWEYQVHGWDLARATGQPWAPDQGPVKDSLGFADGMLTPDFQGEGKPFAPRIDLAADAPALDRLVAMSGRDPRWTPPPA